MTRIDKSLKKVYMSEAILKTEHTAKTRSTALTSLVRGPVMQPKIPSFRIKDSSPLLSFRSEKSQSSKKPLLKSTSHHKETIDSDTHRQDLLPSFNFRKLSMPTKSAYERTMFFSPRGSRI